MFDLKFKLFQEKLSNPQWKQTKAGKSMSIFTLSERDNMVVALKAVCTIKEPVQKIVECIENHLFTKVVNPLIDNFELVNSKGNYKEMYIELKFPFPFSNRDAAISQWQYIDDRQDGKHVVLVTESIPVIKFPRKKGFVRSCCYVGGWDITQERGNPKSSHVTFITHVHPKGSLPVWVINLFSGGEAKKLASIKKVAEHGTTKKSSK